MADIDRLSSLGLGVIVIAVTFALPLARLAGCVLVGGLIILLLLAHFQ